MRRKHARAIDMGQNAACGDTQYFVALVEGGRRIVKPCLASLAGVKEGQGSALDPLRP
jgi:hypothetical protein